MKGLLLYFEQGYLQDYFITVANHLHQRFPNLITLASAQELPKLPYQTFIFSKDELNTYQYKFVWTTADLLDYVNEKAFKLSTFHHAGYGENVFIPNSNTLRNADLIMCATYQPTMKISEHSFQSLIHVNESKKICISAIGYPKFDRCWNACKLEPNKNSIIVCLTDINDIHYDVFKQLEICLSTLLENTKDNIVLRPFPRDLDNGSFKTILSKFSSYEQFSVSKGSYIESFATSKLMVFFGRSDATTAYTYAYSTEKPVLFIEPHILNDIEKRDIGYSLQSAARLSLGIESINNDPATTRILHSRQSSIEYVGASLNRIEKVIERFCFNQNASIENIYEYSLGNEEFNLSKALERLLILVEHIAETAKQHGNSYIITDYLNYYLKQLSPNLLNNQEGKLIQFVIDAESYIQPSLFFSITLSILLKVEKPASIVTDEQLSKLTQLTKNKYLEVTYPSELFRRKTLNLLNYLEEVELSENIVKSLMTSTDYKTLASMIDWARRVNSQHLTDFIINYLDFCKYWDLTQLKKVAHQGAYSFFGEGESTRRLITFIKFHAIPMPNRIYATNPKHNSFEQIRLQDIKDYQDKESILIVSPPAYGLIQERLLKLGIKQNKLIKIVN